MSWEIFVKGRHVHGRSGQPEVSILYPDIVLNKFAMELIGDTTHFKIGFDREENKIALIRSSKDERNSYKLNFRSARSQGRLRMKGAFDYFRPSTGYTRKRFRVCEKDGLFEIDLNSGLIES